MRNLVRELNLEGFSAFCWDSPGHGRSPGERGFSPSFGHIVRDLDAFSRHITSTYAIPQENSVVIANSVGAVVAAARVHDYAPRIRAMVLAAPAFSIKLYVPFALPLLRLQMKLQKAPVVTSYVRPGMLTSDPAEVEAYTQDEMITREVSVRIVSELDEASQRIVEHAIATPTLVLTAGSDWVVRTAPQDVLYSDNALVERSLCALHEGLAPGGLLIYTGQPWHTQLELIARTVPHQDGSPWRMRRRTQAELDGRVRAAGLDKQGMDIDHYEIFTVSVARKEG